jgi:hypothetical protein
MSTYYKYQNPSEIGAAPTLDWGSVISNVNENLQKQEQQRYENREFDKKLANDILTEVNKISQSSDPTLGALIQNHAADIKFNAFNRLKLVQEGKDSRSNYKIFKQNTSASISSLDTFVKNWEPTYKAMVELRAKGLTTKMADAAQDIYGGFQNFTNKKLIQNQSDGFTYTVDIDPDTNQPRKGAFGILPFETLNNIKNFTDLKVNLTEKAASFTDKMKPFITVEMKNGVRTLETPKQEDNKDYAKFLDNAFNSIAFNDNVIADILTNYSDWKPDLLDYNKSNPTDRIVSGRVEGGNIISDITPAMRDEAKAIFEKQLLSQVKFEETPRAEFAPQRAPAGDKDKDKPEPAFGDVGFINKTSSTGKKYTSGLSQSIGNVSFSGGKGVEHVPVKIGYEDGKLWMQGYTITGKESTEGMFGAPSTNVTKKDNWGNVTGYTTDPDTGEKVPVKTDKLTADKNFDLMSLYIKRIPNPKTGKLFKSLKEAEQYYANTLKQGIARARGGNTGGSNANNNDPLNLGI